MAYLYNRFAKGVENKNSGTQMSWWRSNFNMPVPDLYDDTNNWDEDEGVFDYYGVATTFDLSGHSYGWETLVAVTGIHWEDNEGGNQNHTFKQVWKDPNGSIMFTNQSTIYMGTPGTGNWNEQQLMSNQGIAPWEINISGTYSLEVSVSGPSINISQTYNVTFTNVPTFIGYKPSGYMWVEGNKLCYTSANGFVHKIQGDLQSGTGGSGYIWIDGNYLYYTTSIGIKYKCPWALQQFASNFSNGAPGPVTGKIPGFMYMDNEFGWTHIGYIASSGTKFLVGDGNYPYQNPYN